MHLLWLWSIEAPIEYAVMTTEIGDKTVGLAYKLCRSVCSQYLAIHPVQLGGPGVVCQIDESCFSHRPKYHRGRCAEHEVWVFGIVDTSFRPSRAVLQIVDNRSAITLLPIVQSVCRRATIIHSDSWAAYRALHERTGLAHGQVNHSDREHRFVASDGTHTQNIESYWAKRKQRVKAMKGVHRHVLAEYLNEFMWRDQYGESAFLHLIQHIDIVNRH